MVDSEALATFTALQRRGVASRLLYFPDENHWCLKPANSILWHDTVLEWLDRWLKKDKERRGGVESKNRNVEMKIAGFGFSLHFPHSS